MTSGGVRCEDFLRSLGIQNVPRPRAPPRFIRAPSPLTLERPVPIVSDVSLIADSASTSLYSNPELSKSEGKEATVNNSKNGLLSHNNTDDASRSVQYTNFIPTPEAVNNSINSGTTYRRHQSTANNDTLNSTTKSLLEFSNNSAGKSFPTIEEFEVLRGDVTSILQIVSQQNASITKLESQLQNILDFQEKFLLHFVKKGSSLSKEVQTDGETARKGPPSTLLKPNELRAEQQALFQNSRTQQQQKLKSKLQNNPEIVSAPNQAPTKNPSSSPTNNGNTNQNLPTSKGRSSQTSAGEKHTEDVSAMLKNLKIKNIQMPSLYSEASVNSVDVPQFNDNNSCMRSPCHVGPNDSVSAYASSSEDEGEGTETVVPTATFYANLLSNVNRILDSGSGSNSPSSTQGHLSSNDKKQPSPLATYQSQRNTESTRTNNIGTKAPSSIGSTVSYKSDLSSASSSKDENLNPNRVNSTRENYFHQQQPSQTTHSQNINLMKETPSSDNVVDVTKRYLASLGVNFDSPTPPPYASGNNSQANPYPTSTTSSQQRQNYMIQQNVYNSIYIPTVNCVPLMTDSMNSNSGIGVIDNLAHKYLPPSELNQYDILQNKTRDAIPTTETTAYGMMPSNLSFATKQYLQRYGLVGQSSELHSDPQQVDSASISGGPTALPQSRPFLPSTTAQSDRILDITAIRNQPKLL